MEGIVTGVGSPGGPGVGRIVWRGRQSSAHSWRALKAMVRIVGVIKNDIQPPECAGAQVHGALSLPRGKSAHAGQCSLCGGLPETRKEHAEMLALLLETAHIVNPCLGLCLEKTRITYMMG